MNYSAREMHNLALVEALYEQVLNPLDSTHVDRFIAPDYIQHSPLAASGPEPLKRFLDHIKAEHPHATHDVKRRFADGDYVITHTHVRRFPDDPGLAVVDIFRVEDDRIAEHWDVIQAVDDSIDNPETQF